MGNITLREIMDSPLRGTLTMDDIEYFENHTLFEIYLKRNGIRGLYEYMNFRKKDSKKRRIAVIEFLTLYKNYLATN